MKWIARVFLAVVLIFAIGVGGLWIWTRLLVADAQSRFPPVGLLAQVNGQLVHYVDEGEGPTVVLLHGANGALQDWKETVFDDLLARGYRVVAIDRPGHGYSDRPPDGPVLADRQARIVHNLLRQLGVERPVMVGFSWSGALVLSYALQYPMQTAAVVSIAGGAYPWPGPIDLKWRFPTWPVIGDLLVEILPMPVSRFVLEKVAGQAFGPAPVAPGYLENAPVPLALRPGSYRANAEDVRLLKGFLAEQSAGYDQLQLPVVIVHGTGDTVVSPSIHSVALDAVAPDSDLTLIENAGHVLPWSHPKEVLKAIDFAVRKAEAN